MVSHEASLSVLPLALSREGGNIHKPKPKALVATSPASSAPNHLEQDQLQSFTFISTSPLTLSGFHQYLADLPASVVRMKGFLWFAEHGNLKWLFHMSGRHRYDLVCEGPFVAPPSISLVVIGQHFDQDVLVRRLQGASVVTPDLPDTKEESSVYSPAHQYWSSLIQSDSRFELLPSSPSLLRFRLTGAKYYGFTLPEIHVRGVNVDIMNQDLLRALNFLGGDNLLSYEVVDEQMWVLCRGVCADETLPDQSVNQELIQKRWGVVVSEAQKILDFVFKHIHHCACGQ
eukprot:TRINITY_DN14348_c0_g1_i8.p1 TRINITY_DN14348_c0_g1~~TRINITY_DN14348_c0_g1_i8.p1  ORF type:complete len:287 (-),score=55.72 TRINITY_DN14348_c0_g1_i8:17-877(-)